jgi:ACS family hexuronate transporter-like MFS transporter
MKRGWTVNAARKFAILICALMVVPMAFGATVSSTWAAVAILSLATAGHQGWAANMFASLSDMFPANAVSSVTGITGFGGAIGGMCAATAVGFILQATGSYVPAFIWSGCSYLFVLGLIQILIPDIRRIEV